MNHINYTEINAKTWDDWADNGCPWSIPITHLEYLKAQAGEWEVYLTPCRPVPRDWFSPFSGAVILGLASGGGQQIPVFSALGADCTVFDNSAHQLKNEQSVADREGYSVTCIRGDMTQPLPFADESFDMIFHPVSNCYIEKVEPVWQECYRVLKKGGILLAGFDNGLNFLFDEDGSLPLTAKNKLPYNPLRDKTAAQLRQMVENGEGVQFSHSLEEEIGGQLKAGFTLTGLYEDCDRPGCGLLREYAPQYVATRSVKNF